MLCLQNEENSFNAFEGTRDDIPQSLNYFLQLFCWPMRHFPGNGYTYKTGKDAETQAIC